MPGGGIWTVQNKQRPGAYINFKSVPKAIGGFGDRGIVTAALPMTWGPEDKLIELYGTDLLDGKSLAKVGCTAFDVEESLPFRLLLSGSYKALLYRSSQGGVKADASIGNLTVVAKYAGSTGNELSVVVKNDSPEAGKSTIQILFKGKIQEEFVVATLITATEIAQIAAFESNWVNLTATAASLTATSGISLSSGTNGSVVSSYAEYFDLITSESWQCMTIQSKVGSLPPLIKAKIVSMRESLGRKVQAVVYNDNSADYEGIIATKAQGFKTITDTVADDLFLLYVASITAGANINESNTARAIEGATEIIEYIDEADISDNLKAGWFMISYRQDGVVCVEQDINTFRTFTVDKNYAFSKNRVIRALDEVANQVALIFNRNYSGKIDNNNEGRMSYKSEIISMIETRQGIGAFTNFQASDVVVLPGEQLDAVVVDLEIQPVDSMEKLYMTISVNA